MWDLRLVVRVPQVRALVPPGSRHTTVFKKVSDRLVGSASRLWSLASGPWTLGSEHWEGGVRCVLREEWNTLATIAGLTGAPQI